MIKNPNTTHRHPPPQTIIGTTQCLDQKNYIHIQPTTSVAVCKDARVHYPVLKQRPHPPPHTPQHFKSFSAPKNQNKLSIDMKGAQEMTWH